MKTWYHGVCDKHKVFRDIFVTNPSCTGAYLSEKDVEIQKFMSEHFGCSLRLSHLDTEFEEMLAKGYVNEDRPWMGIKKDLVG
jgi:hypothetical protein